MMLTELNLRLYVEESEGREGGMRPATKEELERYAKTVQRQASHLSLSVHIITLEKGHR